MLLEKTVSNQFERLKLSSNTSARRVSSYVILKDKHDREKSQAFFSFTQKINRYNSERVEEATPENKSSGESAKIISGSLVEHIWRRHASEE